MPISMVTKNNSEAGSSPCLKGKDTLAEKLDYYFDSYSHYGIHEEMIKDSVRTSTYRKAIIDNPHLFKDKVVLDIGCGTGILCLFAASAGAKKVIGIECAHIADKAKLIVKNNNYEDVVHIMKGKVEDVELPVDKVDIIVSEWMGYFLLYESMLDTVLFARDKWLKTDGILMPDRSIIYLAGLEDEGYKQQKVHFWDNVYNYDMSCIKEMVLNEPLVDLVDTRNVCTDMIPIFTIDLYTVKKEELDFSANVRLPVLRNDYCHALISFFEVEFTMCDRRTWFSTGPHCRPTHWKQTVFYLTEDLMVSHGTQLDVVVSVRRNEQNKRSLDINIEVNYEGPHVKSSQQRDYAMR